MHEHSLSNIILKLFLDCHHAWLRSWASPTFDIWFFVCPIMPSFRLATNIFSVALCTRKAMFRLGVLPHFSPISLHKLLHAIGDGFRP